jgi:hypothetical protein
MKKSYLYNLFQYYCCLNQSTDHDYKKMIDIFVKDYDTYS